MRRITLRRISLKGNSARIGLLLLVGWLTLGCGSSEPALAPEANTQSAGLAEAAVTPAIPTTVALATPLPPANTPLPPPAVAPAVALEITSDPLLGAIELKTAVVKLARDGTVSVLNEGEEMASCGEPLEDCFPVYGMYFSPNWPAFIYAFQQDSTGQIFPLFPSENYSEQSNPVPAHAVVWVPNDPDHWFYLDDNVGEETIFVVASVESITELEKLVGDIQSNGSGSDDAAAQLVSWLDDPDRGIGGVRKQVVSAPLPDDSQGEGSLEVLVLESTGENQFVYQLTFQHVTPAVLQ